MTINQRIKAVRKDAALNQKGFSDKLGVTQSGVSYMEQNGRNVSDITIKSICTNFNINEDWLRYGTGEMYGKPDTFSLDDFARQKDATDDDLRIVKAYFELDPKIRKAALDFFRNALSDGKKTNELFDELPREPEEFEEQYPPVRSDDSATG